VSGWSGWVPKAAFEAYRQSSSMVEIADGSELRLGASSPSLYVDVERLPTVCSRGCGTELRGCFIDDPRGAFCSIECLERDPLLALEIALRGVRR